MKKLKEKIFIKNIPSYVGGESNIKGKTNVIKLSANENPLGPSPKAILAYNKISNDLAFYPDSSHYILKKSISKIYNISNDNIICGSGSDELINLLCHCYVDTGDEVIHTEHGFAMYKICTTAFGGTPVSVKENLSNKPLPISKAIGFNSSMIITYILFFEKITTLLN